MSPRSEPGCNAPACGKPGRPYACGVRCDGHKPRSSSLTVTPRPVAAEAAKCPGCGTADLTCGRKICQACGVLDPRSMADVTALGDEDLSAALLRAIDEGGGEAHAAVYDESELRSVRCRGCPAQVVGPTGTTQRRYRIVHEETCPWWLRYQAGETQASIPCGAVVTHRGPYRKARAS
jgi:hypothetical protein